MLDLLRQVVTRVRGGEYAEARFERRYFSYIAVTNRVLKQVVQRSAEYAVIRAYSGGSWRTMLLLHPTPRLLEESFQKIVSKLPPPRGLSYTPSSESAAIRLPPDENPATTPIAAKTSLSIVLSEEISKYDDRVSRSTVVYTDEVAQTFFVNSLGSELAFEEGRAAIEVLAEVRDGGHLGYGHLVQTSSMGFRLLERTDPLEIAAHVVGAAIDQLHSRETTPKTLLFTEAALPALLSLLFYSKSAPSLTLIDTGTRPDAYRRAFFDWEGVRVRDVVLFEKGAIRETPALLHDAFVDGRMPTGHAFCEEGLQPVCLPRHLCTLPGDQMDDELTATADAIVKNAILVPTKSGTPVLLATNTYTRDDVPASPLLVCINPDMLARAILGVGKHTVHAAGRVGTGFGASAYLSTSSPPILVRVDRTEPLPKTATVEAVLP